MKKMLNFSGYFLLASFIASGLQATTAQTMSSLVAKGMVQQAFELGQRDQLQESGDLDFDMAYADAAFAANRCTEAIFALERVLINQATNHTARLLQARCYVQLADLALARSSLTIIQNSNAPASLKAASAALLQTVESLTSAKQEISFSINNAVALGLNSNPSSLPSRDIYSVLANSPKRLKGVKISTAWDALADYTLAFNLAANITKGIKNSARLSGNYRKFWSSSVNDSIFLQLHDSLSLAHDIFKFTIPANVSLVFVNYKPAVVTIDLNAEFATQITPIYAIIAKGGFNRTMFMGSPKKNFHKMLAALKMKLDFADVGLHLTGEGFYNFGLALPETLLSSVKNSGGGRASITYNFLPGHSAAVSFLMEDKRYQDINRKFRLKRQDLAFGAKAAWEWIFAKDWRCEPSYSFSTSHSNIPEYRSNQHEVMARIFYDLAL